MKNAVISFLRLLLRLVSRACVCFCVFLIHVYQKTFSFDTGILRFVAPKGSVCVFYPTCSVYSKEALVRFGVKKGLYLSILRIIRCHPWQEPRVDEVPEN